MMGILQFSVLGNIKEALGNFAKFKSASVKAQKGVKKDTDKTNKSLEKQEKNILSMGAAGLGMMWGFARVSPLIAGYTQAFGDALGYIFTVLFESLLPVFEPLLDKMFEFGEWIETQPEWIKELISVMIMVPPAIMLINAAMATMAANPIALAIAALIALIFLLVIHWDDVKAAAERFNVKLGELWNTIQNNKIFQLLTIPIRMVIAVTKELWGVFKNMADKFNGKFGKPIMEVWDKIKQAHNLIIGGIMVVLQSWWDVMKGIVDFMAGLGEKFMSVFEDITEAVGDLLSNFSLQGIMDFFTSIGDMAGDLISSALSWGQDMIQYFIDGLLSMASKLWDAAGEVFDGVKDVFSFDISVNDRMAKNWGRDFTDYFSAGLSDGMSNISDVMSGGQSALTPSPSAVGGGSSSVYNINVDVNGNSISNQLDLNDLARTISESVRRDIGRGI